MVGNVFVLSYAGKLTVELPIILFIKQTARHAKHALHALGEMDDFLLSLHHRYFWSGHQSALDIAQSNRLTGFILTIGQQPTNRAFHLRNQWQEDGCIQHIKAGVEQSEHNGQKCGLA